MASIFNHNGVEMALELDYTGSLTFDGVVYPIAQQSFATQDEFKLWMEAQAMLLRQHLDAIADAADKAAEAEAAFAALTAGRSP